MSTLQERLRSLTATLRRTQLPISAIVPELQLAADRIDELEGAVHSCHPGCTRAGCVNEKLRQAIEEQRRTIDALMCGMPDDGTTPVIRRIAALEAENAALKADAERLCTHENWRDSGAFDLLFEVELDAAIDAVLARGKT